MNKQEDQKNIIEEVYKDKEATINGNDYKFTKMSHKKRLKVFGFVVKHTNAIQADNFGFIGTDEWFEIEKIIMESITYNDMQLSKSSMQNHFDEDMYIGDYMKLMVIALQVIPYPLLKGMR